MPAREILAGLLRYALFALGNWMLANGYFNADDLASWKASAPEIASAVVTVALVVGPPLYWTLRDKIRTMFR